MRRAEDFRRYLRPTFVMLSATAMLASAPAQSTPAGWTTRGPYGGDVPVLAADPAQPGTLYAGTLAGGVYKSTDGAASWRLLERGIPTTDSILALAVDPRQTARVYAATELNGVFRTADGGERWSSASAGLPDQATVSTLAIDPADPTLLYAGTRASGLFRSRDGGASWQPAGAGPAEVRFVAVEPSSPATLYSATGEGVYKSVDGGATWQALGGGLDPGGYDKIVVDPARPGTAYALVTSFSGRLFKTADGGVSWQPIAFSGSGFLRDLALDPSDPDVLYAATASNSDVFKSTDGGLTWSDGSDGITALIPLAVLVDPHDPATVYAGAAFDHGIFRSTDGGVQWSAANQGLHNTDVADLEIDPLAPATVYASSENGVFKSLDGGGGWTSVNDGLFHVSTAALAIDPQNPEVVYAGSDFGLLGRGIYKTENGGGLWQLVTDPFGPLSSTSDLIVDPQTPATVYAASGDQVLKTVDGGGLWEPTASAPPGAAILDLALDERNPSTLYAATIDFAFNSRVVKSVDGGDSWAAADAGLEGGIILSLAVDPRDSARVYAAGLGGAYRSADGGASWRSTSALPAGFGLALAVDPQAPATLYVSTVEGVSKSIDRGDHWFPLNDGLSHVPTDLEVDPQDPAIVHAGTGGGGAFRLIQDFECVPGATTLCIDDRPGDRRFEISLDFETELGGFQTGAARATSLAELGITRGGILSFFGTANPEVLVKVLDGCGFNGHFWIFYAATTTVGFDLKVTDTVAGVSQVYRNADQNTAATITDIEAFPTCDAGRAVPRRHPDGILAERPAGGRAAAARAALEQRPGTAENLGVCVADATTLCIDDQPGDRRFRVTAAFDTVLGAGAAGDAEALPLASLGITRGGILSFFDSGNPEVLIKVLDGCDFNDRFWVFYAATTNAGFTLRVEDTFAGFERVFGNPDLSAAEPVTEIDAFATCDL